MDEICTYAYTRTCLYVHTSIKLSLYKPLEYVEMQGQERQNIIPHQVKHLDMGALTRDSRFSV